MKISNAIVWVGRAGFFCVALSAPAYATPLVYTPVNPDFGGNPGNASLLLSEAQAQNQTSPPAPNRAANQLQAFNNALQSAVLNRVSSAVIQQIVGPTGKLNPGTVETQDFIIQVTQPTVGGPVTVTTTDKATGQTSTFEIGNTTP